ncbi:MULTISPECIES: sialidase family protein [Arenibacter]|uniref:sialidase family protein n=1 Tax=Arenibacter TaxID=178469 RepID=UPI00054E766C|nr:MULTISPECIES: sialidase family protein [Arenibacter]GBF19488.1 hypothetical protein C21_01654 [Arenibacter sp. NBRC 103722]
MKKVIVATISLLIFFVAFNGISQSLPERIKVSKIYSDENYNAFTSLIRFKGDFYCAFRSGERHVYGKDGVIKIITSKDGKAWKDVDQIALKGFDLRDPKLSVTPEGLIMATMGGSIYEGKTLLGGIPHVAFSNPKGTKFSPPKPIRYDANIKSKFDWLWSLTWYEGTGYGGMYSRIENKEGGNTTLIKLVKTTNGLDYIKVADLEVEGNPNESTIRFLPNGDMLMLIRREQGNKRAYLGQSSPPYTDWSFTESPYFIGGPDFVSIGEGQYIGGGRINREYTGLVSFGKNGDFREVLKLPSNSDSSYPGFVFENDTLYMSYYSSHETEKTSIYFAEIPLVELK